MNNHTNPGIAEDKWNTMNLSEQQTCICEMGNELKLGRPKMASRYDSLEILARRLQELNKAKAISEPAPEKVSLAFMIEDRLAALKAERPSPDPVNHPAHYGGDTVYEAVKVIDAWELDFYLGNAVKYIARAGKKDPAKTVEDLEKAAWYLKRKIDKLKSE